MEFKCECDPHGRKEPSGINRIIMEFKSVKFIRFSSWKLGINRIIIMELKDGFQCNRLEILRHLGPNESTGTLRI